jgi:PsbP
MRMLMLPALLFANAVLNATSFSLPQLASVSPRNPSVCYTMTDAAEDGMRRTWMLQSFSAASVLTVGSSAAVAVSEAKQTCRDEKYGFTIDFPSSWSKMEDITSLSDRRTISVFTDPSDPSTSLLIVYTPIRDDFTSLNSFGSVDQVAAQTILPKGALADVDTDVTAKMISASSTKQSYIFDYLQKVPQVQQPWTHYRTIFTLGNPQENAAGAVLVTITLQTPESRYPTIQSTFDSIIDSYQRV